MFCSFVCLSLLLLLCAFYVRVDTVISRNGMNKVFCTYSLERQSQCHLMHPFSATALTSKFSVFCPVCLFSVIVSFTLHRRQELVAHNLKWDNETWIKLEALPAGTIQGHHIIDRSEYLRAQIQGHHIIDRSEERGVERESGRRSSLKGRERASVSQTSVGTVSKATLGKPLKDRAERIWAFPSRYHLELN